MPVQTFDAEWVADRLGVTADTVRTMARRKDISHVRVGRRIRFTEQNVEDYIAAHTIRVGMARTARSQAAHKKVA